MWILLAALASGLLWFGGTGLHPIAVLTWLAPIPLLIIALRVRPLKAVTATAAAWLIGQANVVGYYRETLHLPIPLVVGVVALGALLAVGTVMFARSLLLTGRPVTAVLVVPALWVMGEFVVSRALANGAWWSLAYTQAGVRPIIQLTALTGVWGVTYLLFAVPIALAALQRSPRAAVACLAVLTAVTVGWSVACFRLDPPDREERSADAPVGLIALEQPEDGMPIDQAAGRELLARYAARAEGLAARGARIIVLPEKVFRLTDSTLPRLVEAFRPVGARIVVGAVLDRHNVALLVEPSGATTTYAKQHLIPAVEDWLTAGHDDLIIDGHLGVVICKDLDFPELVRRYRAEGTTTMLVPALDFREDGWLHSRMALVRGIENGMTVVRAAGLGRLTVTGPTGEVLGEVTAGDDDLLVTAVPAARRTVYSWAGDWFLVLLIAAVISSASGSWWGRARAARARATTASSTPAWARG